MEDERTGVLQPNGVVGILFDLDGTLRHNRPDALDTFCRVTQQSGFEVSSGQRRRAARWTHYYWASSQDLQEDLERFEGADEDFWFNYTRRHLEAFDCPLEQVEHLAPEVHRLMRVEYNPEDWVPPDVPETLNMLRQAGFRLGVLSNRSQPCDDLLREMHLEAYFDLVLVAGELQVWKPDPQVFLRALERFQTQPSQTLYIGDNYYADVVGARDAGLLPILVDPYDIFPDAGCPAIRTLGELPELLRKKQYVLPT